LGVLANNAGAATPTTIGLGTAGAASVLAGAGVTNTGSSVLNLDLDTSPTAAITGFPPGIVNGTKHPADGVAQLAQSDLTTAYNAAASAPSTSDVTGVDLSGKTLTAGVYTASSSMAMNGPLALTLNGTPDSVFIFQAGSTLITGSNSSVLLNGGVQACNVFWQVGSSATLGTNTAFIGNILSQVSITLTTGATVDGRALARTGSVTLDSNVFTTSACTPPGSIFVTPTSTTTSTTTAPAGTTAATPTTTPGTPTTPDASAPVPTSTVTTVPGLGGSGATPFATPGVPKLVGPPRTGGAPLHGHSELPSVLSLIELSTALAIAAALGLAIRRRRPPVQAGR
ncbi:MAG: hypothetical protein QOG64_1691, partial [Acidimicrobiaceae bacterium]|nr:hypothetical protein [Acidimicrobiaceae bacterium]